MNILPFSLKEQQNLPFIFVRLISHKIAVAGYNSHINAHHYLNPGVRRIATRLR